MKPIVQEDNYGCGVASVAFILKTDYKKALKLFANGDERVKETSDFYCREICKVLGSDYVYRYLKPRLRNKIYNEGVMVFIKKSKKHKHGHYLVRHNDMWMDPWINFPDEKRKAGYRKRLPGEPIYIIAPSAIMAA